MKQPQSPRHLVPRVGLTVGIALLAGVLLTVSIAVSAGPVPPSAAPPPAAVELNSSALTQVSETAPDVGARPSRFPQASKVSFSAQSDGARNSADPADEVQRAWQRASDLGVYHFATSLVERRYPAPSLANVGGGPQQQEARLEGEADLPARRLTLRLWQGGGSAANAADAAELLIEGDKSYTRRFGGGTWQPAEDLSGSFAPDANLLSYLAGIKNVTRLGTDARSLPGGDQVEFTRYGFEMDGPALAAYMRNRLEQVLQGQGKLPPGVTLETSRQYRDLAGEGEVWLDTNGLPLRLALHLIYPAPKDGSRSEADITTDFSGFPEQLAAAPKFTDDPLAWAGAVLQSGMSDASLAGRLALALAIAFALAALIVVGRRSYRVYVAVAVAVILAMTVVPLLQDVQVSAYMEKQAAQRTKAAEAQQGEQKAREYAARQTGWDPQRDPLAGYEATPASAAAGAPAQPDFAASAVMTTDSPSSTCDDQDTADDDKDGLNNFDECIYATDPKAPDMDSDGLTDSQEVTYLGTDPAAADSDGDMITDTLEVEGFVYPEGGQHWYLDPRNPDTNSDGLSDGLDCPPLREGDTSLEAIRAECDTDGDGAPNPFDEDNDNDAVIDKVDISPNQVLDQNGVRTNGAGVTAFDQDHPFSINVQGLDSARDWPVFLDVQLRPEDPKHLTYALNVLDWPAKDTDGQVQHVKETTFATTDSPDTGQDDSDAGAWGDMRLVPMLEIEMSGASLPLRLTTPAITATVASGSSVFSTTVRFEQDMADAKTTHMAFTFAGTGKYGAKITSDPCPGSGSVLWSATNIDNTTGKNQVHTEAQVAGWLNTVANDNHALVISQGSSAVCANIPNIVNGPYADKMVDQGALEPYSIGLREATDDANASVLAYVPLSPVSDDTGGGRSAFSARMLYWTGADSSWIEAQKVRVTWTVQALTDSCEMGDFPTSLEEYQKQHPGATQEDYNEAVQEHCLDPKNRTPDKPQIIQGYDETFHITGLAITEDHGLDVAVAYPNPDNPYDEHPLWQVSWGLGQVFLSGRDCENDDSIHTYSETDACDNPDGKRDLTVARTAYRNDPASPRIANSTIYERFGTDGSAWKDSPALWDIVPGSLVVEDHRYDTEDYLTYVATNVTPGILKKFPTGLPSVSLLFAREQRYRSAGLEGGTASGGLLTMDVGGDTYTEQTLAFMSWAPFRYNAGVDKDGRTIGWEAYPFDEYYDTLGGNLQAFFSQYLKDNQLDSDPETIAGQAEVGRAYYVSLYIGLAGLVAACPEGEEGEKCLGDDRSQSDEDVTNAAERAGEALVAITDGIIEETVKGAVHFQTHDRNFDIEKGSVWVEEKWTIQDALPWYRSLGQALDEYGVSPWKTLASGAGAMKMLGSAMAAPVIAVAVVLFVSLSLNTDWRSPSTAKLVSTDAAANTDQSILWYVKFTLTDAAFDIQVIMAARATSKFVKWAMLAGEVAAEGEALEAARLAKEDLGKGGVLRLVIQLVLHWAAFVLVWGLGGLSAGGMVWDQQLATAIAWTFTALILYAIACIPYVGQLIAAIIVAIDGLVKVMCDALLSPEQQQSNAGSWLCKGLEGITEKIIQRLIYSGTLLPDMNPDEFPRLTLGNFGIELLYPERGVREDNSIKSSVILTNTLKLADQPDTLVTVSDNRFWDADHLKQSNFAYKWQDAEKDIHEGLSLGEMEEPGWRRTTGNPTPVAFTKHLTTEEAFPLPPAGINRPVVLYLSEGFAIPESECWGVLFIADCRISTVKKTMHYPMGNSLRLDVMPKDLDGFYALDWSPSGQQLGWDGLFPALHDADGDGLPFSSDPDDTRWDTDDDGLSDQYEVESGSDPALRDGDKDGLNDLQEARLGSNPRLADSDGDGVYDCEEVFHQVIEEDQLGGTPGSVCGKAGKWTGGWSFVYGWDAGRQLMTWVSADPNDPDEDADSYADSQEQVYGFNPGVPSQSEILSLDSQITEPDAGGQQIPSDNYVKPGETLQYTATVKNALDAREAEGLLWTEGSEVLEQGDIDPQSFVLLPQQEVTMTGGLDVGSSASGVYSLTQVAGALITDWRALSGNADLWLRFDDDAGASTYLDTSGSIPPNNGQCVGLDGAPAAGPCSIVPAGGRYGSALQLNGQGYVHSAATTVRSASSIALWFNLPFEPGRYSLLVTTNELGPELTLDVGPTAQAICAWAPDGNVYDPASVSGACRGEEGFNVADGNWHQLVVSCQGRHRDLYVDGQLSASNDDAGSCGEQGEVRVGGPGEVYAVGYYGPFPGKMDDVRVYPYALTASDVRDLFNQPVFRMNFEQHTISEWKDVSGYDSAVTPGASPNTPNPTSVGAVGWGAEFDGQDYISVGGPGNDHLNLSGGQFTFSAWLYPESGSGCYSAQNILGNPGVAHPYPTLGVDDTDVTLDVGGIYAISDVTLTRNTWNHLVVAYDSTGGGGPYATAKIYLNGEPRFPQVVGQDANPHPRPDASATQFYIGAQPGGPPSFCGKMDEVQIFNYLLTDDGVKELLLNSAVALRLPMDEAPGAKTFADTSTLKRAVGCDSKESCPTSGVAGRINQAASFNTAPGHTGDHLVLANSEINGFSDRLTVAAWIKADSVSSLQRIAGMARTHSNDGWAFGTSGSELEFTNFGVKDYFSTGANLKAGQWYHVAAVFDAIGSNSLQFYLNGQPLGAAIKPAPQGKADSSDALFIGGVTEANSSAVSQQWHGMIDDLVIFNTALPASRISELYSAAPVLHLRFDDSTSPLANNADPASPGACVGEACPLTGEGIKGQVGLAAQFDGLNDSVVIKDFGTFTTTTVSAWVRRTGATAARETILSYKEPQSCGFVLSLNEDGKNQLPRFTVLVQPAGGSAAWQYAESTIPVAADSWQRLAGTYDGETIRLYQNGSQVASTAAPGTIVQCSLTSSVGAHVSNEMHYFPGLIDEVQVFDHAVSGSDIHDAFVYENGWVEDRQSRNLTVDTDDPTVQVVVADPPYQANWPTQVLVTADDVTSGVDTVQFCEGADADCKDAGEAPHCVDPASASAWCPIFDPSPSGLNLGQGVYSLRARATDRVGHWTLSEPQDVYVDDSAPRPTLASPANGWYTATEYEGKSNTWTVHFSGSVTDPDLGGGVPGSGVPADGVRVTLYRSDGGVVGAGPQTATVTGGTWALDYLDTDADPSGCYKIVVEAVDNVARLAGLPAAQVAAHTGTVEQQISIDADAPAASIDWSNLPQAQLGPAATVLKGDASARPVPVVLTFTGGTNSAQTELVLACQHGNQGSWWEPYNTKGMNLETDRVYTWGQNEKPSIHHGSTCEVRLTTKANTDDLSGNVTVCGVEVLKWSGDFAVPGETLRFTVDSPGCNGGNGCPTGVQKATAGVQGVDVRFLPTMPGSPFFNEPPLSGEIFHATLDSSQNSAGDPTFPEVSGSKLTGTCSGTQCPVPGQQGHGGSAALFDGVDDRVTFTNVPGQGSSDYFSVAAWIYPTGNSRNRSVFVSRLWSWEVAVLNDGTIRWLFYNTYRGPVWGITAGQIPLNQWTHLVVVYDGGLISTYANGVLTTPPFSGSGSVSMGSTLNIGGEPHYGDWFAGLIDDVRVFDRALTVDEIKALTIGSGPQLVLPFEKQWAADGSQQEDTSGWQHDGILHTGPAGAPGKVVAGAVGAYALQLDGVDDYVDAGSQIALANASFTAAFWAKRNATGRFDIALGQGMMNTSTLLHIGFRDNDKFTCAFFADDLDTDGAYTDTDWHHWACTYDASTKLRTIYRDGVSVKQAAAAADYQGSGNLYVGMYPQASYYFNGSIDDVRIYPRTLSDPEVQALYLGGWQAAGVTESGPAVDSTGWEMGMPKWLEGSYRIEARGWDTDDHTSPPRSSEQTWSGEADTLAPRVTLTRSGSAGAYRYTTTAEDYNLTEAGLITPCPAGTPLETTDFQSPWYVASFPTTPRLFQAAQECLLNNPAAGEQATACDTFGNCTTVSASIVTSAASVEAETPGPAAAPAEGGETVSGAPGLPVTASAEPGGEVEIGPGDEAAAARSRRPDLAFAPTVLTTTHLYPPAVIDVTGLLTGTRTIKEVTVSVGGVTGPAILAEPSGHSALTTTWSFPWPLGQNPLPDGVTFTAVATGTRTFGGPPIVKTQNLLVDVAPPGPVTPALQSDGVAVERGDTLRAEAPELLLTWPPATDGSGIAGYLARWTVHNPETTTLTTRAIGPGGPLEDRYTAGEAEWVTVDLGSRDRWGNVRWQELGPVVADSPRTPDYIAMGKNPYQGWQESGCTLLGADRRWERQAGGKAQRLYATWDRQALRMAWSGATWSSDGDLFLYLDTGEGGTNTVFTPSGVASGGLKPSNEAMLADYVVWVQDVHTATLLRWDGSAWGTPVALTEEQFRFDSGRKGGQTDLYLPFDLIALSQGSSLGLLAMAVEEPVAGQELRVWAALPQYNPVNSPRVNRMLNFLPAGAELPFKHEYKWAALGDRVCPNGEPTAHFSDVDPQLSAQSDPPGVGLSGLGRGLFWVTPSMLGNGDALNQQALRFATPSSPPLDVGQKIHYLVRYRNAGTETQHGVRLALTGYGVVDLPESVLLGDDGDVAPGAEARVVFEGEVTGAGPEGAWAAVKGLLYDTAHTEQGEPLDWLWSAHRVDQSPPDAVSISRPRTTVGPGKAVLGGTAHDESGVAKVEVEISGPNGTSAITCPVERPAEGRWLCAWDVGGSGLPHGTQFSLSARATDTLGQTSGWTTPQPVRLDVLPPVLRVTSVLTTTVVRGGTKLFGTAIDESGMAVVWVCVDGECGRANLLATDGESTSWMYPLPASPADYVDKTISIEGIDRVGNRTAALRAVVTLDNVPPELTGIQLRVQEPLGEQMRVLQGEARDGDPSERVFILVRAPDNAKSWHNAARSGELWWYDLTGEMPGRHSLWVQAVDRTGNARTKGPYTVDVTCTDAGLATTLSVEPGTGSDYTVSAVISNTGPAPSPAGVQVTLYADETPLAAPSVLPALTKGQASAVSAQWTRPGPGGYEFRAVVTQPQAEVLCATPPAGHARVGPDVDLRISKTVQPAAARPGDVITYTLVYTNAGAYPAAGVTISDPLPAEILSPTYQSTGAVITPTVGSDAFAWEVEDLAGGLGGRIVITGTVDPAATPPFTLTNTVTITTLYDTAPADNVASVELRVLKEIEQPTPRVWLPWVVR